MSAKKSGSMDPIQLPDQDQIRNLSGGYVNSRRVYKESSIDDFTNAVRPNFDSAAPIKVPERTEQNETPLDEMDKLIEEEKKKQQNKTKRRGYKVGGKYVAAWLVRRIVIIAVCVLLFAITFLPPITLSTSEGEVLSGDIFGSKSVSQLRQEVLANDFVYNIDAMSSELPKNYRVCTVKIDLKNFSPYKVILPGFSVVTSDVLYKDKIISARLDDGECEISPFSVKTVTVEVLLNVNELTTEQFDKLMTSIILRTNGLRKKLGPISIPTVPAFVFVSDSLEYNLEA